MLHGVHYPPESAKPFGRACCGFSDLALCTPGKAVVRSIVNYRVRFTFFQRLLHRFGSTLDQMRRVWVTLLALLFSFPLISPAVWVLGTESSLATCCRRSGTHHCA